MSEPTVYDLSAPGRCGATMPAPDVPETDLPADMLRDDNGLPELSQLDVVRPEATFLVWLDCRRLGLGKEQLKRFMLDEARVYLSEGFHFGPEGEGFERMNIACPRSILGEALERIKRAINRLANDG